MAELSFGPLTVSFGKQTRETYYDVEKGPRTTPATAIAEPNHIKQSADALEQDEIRLREEEIAELLITDPLRAEELIRDGELEEDERTDTE